MIQATTKYLDEAKKSARASRYIVEIDPNAGYQGQSPLYFSTELFPGFDDLHPEVVNLPAVGVKMSLDNPVAGQGGISLTFKREPANNPFRRPQWMDLTLEDLIVKYGYFDGAGIKIFHTYADFPDLTDAILIWSGEINTTTEVTETTISLQARECSELNTIIPIGKMSGFPNVIDDEIKNEIIPILYGGSLDEISETGISDVNSYKAHKSFAKHIFPSQLCDADNNRFVVNSERGAANVLPGTMMSFEYDMAWLAINGHVGKIVYVNTPAEVLGINGDDFGYEAFAIIPQTLENLEARFALYPDGPDSYKEDDGDIRSNKVDNWRNLRPDISGYCTIDPTHPCVVGFGDYDMSGIYGIRIFTEAYGSGSLQIRRYYREADSDGDNDLKDKNDDKKFLQATVTSSPTVYYSDWLWLPKPVNSNDFLAVINPFPGGTININKLWFRVAVPLMKFMGKVGGGALSGGAPITGYVASRYKSKKLWSEKKKSSVFFSCQGIGVNKNFVDFSIPIMHILEILGLEYSTDMLALSGAGNPRDMANWQYRKSITEAKPAQEYLKEICGESCTTLIKKTYSNDDRRYSVVLTEPFVTNTPTGGLNIDIEFHDDLSAVDNDNQVLAGSLKLWQDDEYYNKFKIRYDKSYIDDIYRNTLILTRTGDGATSNEDNYTILQENSLLDSYQRYDLEKVKEIEADWITTRDAAFLLAANTAQKFYCKKWWMSFDTNEIGNILELGDIIKVHHPQLDTIIPEGAPFYPKNLWQVYEIAKSPTRCSVVARQLNHFPFEYPSWFGIGEPTPPTKEGYLNCLLNHLLCAFPAGGGACTWYFNNGDISGCCDDGGSMPGITLCCQPEIVVAFTYLLGKLNASRSGMRCQNFAMGCSGYTIGWLIGAGGAGAIAAKAAKATILNYIVVNWNSEYKAYFQPLFDCFLAHGYLPN